MRRQGLDRAWEPGEAGLGGSGLQVRGHKSEVTPQWCCTPDPSQAFEEQQSGPFQTWASEAVEGTSVHLQLGQPGLWLPHLSGVNPRVGYGHHSAITPAGAAAGRPGCQQADSAPIQVCSRPAQGGGHPERCQPQGQDTNPPASLNPWDCAIISHLQREQICPFSFPMLSMSRICL